MECMSTSVDSVCFPLWNVLDQISPVLGSTGGHVGYLTLTQKLRYQLEVLLFHFRKEMAVCSLWNTSDPEMEVSGIFSKSLWTQELERITLNGQAASVFSHLNYAIYPVILAHWLATFSSIIILFVSMNCSTCSELRCTTLCKNNLWRGC